MQNISSTQQPFIRSKCYKDSQQLQQQQIAQQQQVVQQQSVQLQQQVAQQQQQVDDTPFQDVDTLDQVAYYTQLMKQDPQNPEHPFDRARMLRLLLKHKEAIEAYSEAIALGKNTAECYCRRGNALYELDKYEEALEDFKMAIALEPENGMHYYHAGNALCTLGRYVEGVAAYDRAIARGWNREGCYTNRRYALSQLEQNALSPLRQEEETAYTSEPEEA
ncbi:Tetratricopeptide repeat-containing protein [Rickettsiales endosymbiont of Paramecium tredecaurelia]|uniref:tetratricopeptide repeat protein n=1 Tax=Candidatus Sarmatiella mevalonica TaxID=2770581 RepID=UPI001924A981|nr:tetratricopeptide repeat protein [Candidatus Sarmatiella mevalonica]MBL3285004.1 Tetratricopeptide repeat-containing protein [Candidatus Sarmatiella mevalonica]